MDKLEKFLEFIRENPPPCFLGESTYMFNSETGKIVLLDKPKVVQLAVNEDGEWSVAYDEDEEEFFKIDEGELDCSTYENAKKFRDELVSIKYAVFTPAAKGNFEYNGQQYDCMEVKTLPVSCMEKEDSYIDAILRQENEIIPGTIIETVPGKYEEVFSLILENNQYKQFRCHFEAITQKGEAFLEKLYD